MTKENPALAVIPLCPRPSVAAETFARSTMPQELGVQCGDRPAVPHPSNDEDKTLPI